MSNGAGAILAAGLGVGVYWLYVETQKTQQPVYVPGNHPQTNSTGGKKGFDPAPLLSWGIDFLNGKFGTTTTTTGPVARRPDTLPGRNTPTAPVSRPPSTLPKGNLERRLLDFIGRLEAPRGYDQVYGKIRAADKPPRRLTTMTVAEVLAWQDSIDRRYNSEAAGRFQILEDTLRGLVAQGSVSMNATFDRTTQERAAIALMVRRGLNDYKSGRISAQAFGQRLSMEWASLPALTVDKKGRPATGQSYYAGDGLNHALTTQKKFLAVLEG